MPTDPVLGLAALGRIRVLLEDCNAAILQSVRGDVEDPQVSINGNHVGAYGVKRVLEYLLYGFRGQHTNTGSDPKP